ncbi:MAG: ligase-associated DNA damage response DEXH box helicase [Bacteroidetes bacterium]|nr:ligase-associated DNA damage response DEXH box helicase [Bacteroidota bacterium]
MNLEKTTKSYEEGIKIFKEWGWTPFDFQQEAWMAYDEGFSGIINAPTGSGKTYSLAIPILQRIAFNKKKGLQAIWITPIRALAKEIEMASTRAAKTAGWKINIGTRTGDTNEKTRKKQKEKPPQLLITTPESLHLLLSTKGYEQFFEDLDCLVADEWHELLGTKRGVQLELALSRLRGFRPNLKTWGISATIKNLKDSAEILLGNHKPARKKLIRSEVNKKIEVISILPEKAERLPWAGHLGIRMLKKVLPIIQSSNSTLIFTNTRSFAEIWYQQLLEQAPELSGLIAMHHGSISRELRDWVEEQLHEGKLKAVVCTASLDLGVDFRPVETVVQVGSPKGIARFIQRAGRSGHQPGAISKIYFLPTHSLELTEAVALREGINNGIIEERVPHIRSFDVLLQFLVTLAIGEGLDPKKILKEIRQTKSFESLSDEEWEWLLEFLVSGGKALDAYDEYRKLEYREGKLFPSSTAVARRHRMSIGTIVGDTSFKIKYVTGKYLGTIEEYFISQLSPGDSFWFAGRSLELVRVRGMEAQVRNSKKKTGKVPSWQGGRMPLSSPLGHLIRKSIHDVATNNLSQPELKFIKPLTDLQKELSHLPTEKEFLIEYLNTDEGWHLLMYPFEGRFVHEGLAAIVANRIAQLQPVSFSIAMNDYGFELLSSEKIPIEEILEGDLFNHKNLSKDIQASVNATEMARRKFREIAAISGLIFKGFPGAPLKGSHLQSSAQMFFDVFLQYDPDNLLLQQSFEEVIDFQLEEARMRAAMERINRQKIVLKYPKRPTPFAFPVMVDRLRENMSTEQLLDRIKKMTPDFQDPE